MPACFRFTRMQLVFIGVCSAYLCQARLKGEEEAFLESFLRIYFSRYPLQRQHHPTIESEAYAREFITGVRDNLTTLTYRGWLTYPSSVFYDGFIAALSPL
jgi:hypothetical protein